MRKNNITLAKIIIILIVFISCQDPNSNLESIPLIPFPKEIKSGNNTFRIKKSKKVTLLIDKDNKKLVSIAEQIKKQWGKVIDYDLEVVKNKHFFSPQIILKLSGDLEEESKEKYKLVIKRTRIIITASTYEGLYRGWNTLYQIIFFSNKKRKVFHIPMGIIKDSPEYNYRGAMLDVSRHFFNVNDIKRYIDLLSLYKINFLHLHLSDDQGWRIEIKSWPNLTAHGGKKEVGGGKGGFFTQENYKDIVHYAQQKFIVIVPEIDMPGHTNAALSSYPELNCDGKSPKLYTGINVGFSSLCAEKPITYKFIKDVIDEISALTPGPYIHIGGDESHVTDKKDYIQIIDSALNYVYKNKKIPIGWDEIQAASIKPTTIGQYWARVDNAEEAIQKGSKLLISPAHYTYLDMKYDCLTELGLNWAGYINVKKAYEWSPLNLDYWPRLSASDDKKSKNKKTILLKKENIIGIEAPLWTETIEDFDDLSYMAFPRILGYAEVGWIPYDKRNWKNYKKRLAKHKKILDKYQINYYQSPLIDW